MAAMFIIDFEINGEAKEGLHLAPVVDLVQDLALYSGQLCH
jgi:hypothetical protein